MVSANTIDPRAETERLVSNLTLEDLPDPEADRREAEARGFNAGLELGAALVRLNGDKKMAALILRQRKFAMEVMP
jgi:hypothetical protein